LAPARAKLDQHLSGQSQAPQVEGLFVHRLHDGTDDAGQDCTPARAANRIAEKAAQRPSSSRIGARCTTEKASKNRTASNTANRTADDLGQLAHRHLLQDRSDGLTAEDTSNNLNDDRKKCFHVEIPRLEPRHNRLGNQDTGQFSAMSQVQTYGVHRLMSGADVRLAGQHVRLVPS